MPTEAYLAVSALLFAVGSAGVIARGNAISALVGAQLMLDGAILAVAAAAQRYADVSGELAAGAFIVGGAVALAAGLAIALDVTRRDVGADVDRAVTDP